MHSQLTHVEVAVRVAENVSGWTSRDHRDRYVVALVRHLDAGRCSCPRIDYEVLNG